MVDKGPDVSNPLAIFGASVLSAAGAWFLSQFVRKPEPHAPDNDDEEGCAKKGEMRTMRSDFKGDIAYIVERLDAMGERIDGVHKQISRMRRDGGGSTGD